MSRAARTYLTTEERRAKARDRRAALRDRGLCINGVEHGSPVPGRVRCAACIATYDKSKRHERADKVDASAMSGAVPHAMEARRFRILQALYRNGLDWLDLGDLHLRIGESGTGTNDHSAVLARLVAEGYVEKRGRLPATGAPMEIRQASARITPAGRAHFRAELARLAPPKEHFQW